MGNDGLVIKNVITFVAYLSPLLVDTWSLGGRLVFNVVFLLLERSNRLPRDAKSTEHMPGQIKVFLAFFRRP